MSFRVGVAVYGLLMLCFIAGKDARAEQHNADNAPPMTYKETVSREFLVKQLHLEKYEATLGDLSVCGHDHSCLEGAEEIKSWLCASDVCDKINKSKTVMDCFPDIDIAGIYPKDVLNRLGSLICPLIKSPSTKTRDAIWKLYPQQDTRSRMVEYGAYLMALKGSGAACRDYIKNYIGPYGPQWNFQWYSALAGCRILAHERTRQQEEKDFDAWFGVVYGTGNCSSIMNGEMHSACMAPGAGSPAFVSEQ